MLVASNPPSLLTSREKRRIHVGDAVYSALNNADVEDAAQVVPEVWLYS